MRFGTLTLYSWHNVWTIKFGYNEHAGNRPVLFIIAVIYYIHEELEIKFTLLRNSREFVVKT
jgi:hypothetical protein